MASPQKRRPRPKASEKWCNIMVDGETLCIYPLDDIMEEFGRRWTLLVVAVVGSGPVRFTQIQTALNGVSPRTLTERLKSLERLGILDREAFNEVPLHVEYTLTRKGRTLLTALAPLLHWAADETAR